MKQKTKDLIKISLFMNTFEWYDFGLFATMSFYIGKLFFNTNDPLSSIISGVFVFTSAWLTRPLGALLIGYLGLKKGSAQSLQWSMFLMVIPTFLIAFLPTYQSIGIWATIIIIVLRLIQGIGSGAESASCFSYVFDFKNNFTSIKVILIGAYIAIMLSSFTVLLFEYFISKDLMLNWVWRIPFLLTLPIAFFVFKIRRNILSFAKPKNPRVNNLKLFVNNITKGFFISAQFTTLFISTMFWYPSYLKHVEHLSLPFIQPFGLICMILFIFVSMSLNQFHKHRLLLIGTGISIILVPIFFYIHVTIIWAYVIILVFAWLNASIAPKVSYIITNLFPKEERVIGVGLTLAISNILFSALIFNLILHYAHNYLGIYISILGILVIGFILFFLKKSEKKYETYFVFFI